MRRLGAIALAALALSALTRAVTVSEAAPGDRAPVFQAATRHARAPAPAVPAAPAPAAAPQQAWVVPAGRTVIRVPILMYHYIRVNPDPRDRLGFGLSVTPADFGRQMSWLASAGFHPIDLEELRGYLLGGGTLPGRPVVLTFDDGYRDLYTTAYPILRAHRFKAVSYLPSGFVGSPQSVSVDQVLDMDAHGIQIGAHSVSHADLTKLSPSDLAHEVRDSRATLEALLGHPVLDFCYPYGRVNDAVAEAVKAAGYQTATTTQPGLLHSANDRFLWTRVRVDGGESLEQFAAGLAQLEAGDLVTLAPAPPLPLHGPVRPEVTVALRLPPQAAHAAPPVEGPRP